MKKIVIGIIFLGLANLGYSQSSDCGDNKINLSEVEVFPEDQSYWNEVSDGVISTNVYNLEKKASRYKIQEHPHFSVDTDKIYEVKFTKDQDRIVAKYDNNGKIKSSSEVYKDLNLPPAVRNSVYKENPDWTLHSTAYTVYYNGRDAKRTYKVQLIKDNNRKNLKFDVDGNRIK